MCSTNKNVCTTFLDLPLADAVVGAALEVEVALLLTVLVCPLTRASGISSGGFILVCPSHQNLVHPLRNNSFLRTYGWSFFFSTVDGSTPPVLSKQRTISTCNSIPENPAGKVWKVHNKCTTYAVCQACFFAHFPQPWTTKVAGKLEFLEILLEFWHYLLEFFKITCLLTHVVGWIS